jgi:hypothetical protein
MALLRCADRSSGRSTTTNRRTYPSCQCRDALAIDTSDTCVYKLRHTRQRRLAVPVNAAFAATSPATDRKAPAPCRPCRNRHRHRRAPESLPRHTPIANAISDCGFAESMLLRVSRHFRIATSTVCRPTRRY